MASMERNCLARANRWLCDNIPVLYFEPFSLGSPDNGIHHDISQVIAFIDDGGEAADNRPLILYTTSWVIITRTCIMQTSML